MTATPRELFEKFTYYGLIHDGDGQADLFATDGVMEWPFAPTGVPRRTVGREAIRDLLLRLHEGAKEDPVIINEGEAKLVLHETGDPQVAIAEIDVKVTKAEGVTERSLVQIYRVREGQIAWLRDYFDGDEMTAWLKV
jgi:ketosteroid isomerase-like protein